jgi:kojibiose phosphorylase
MSTINAHLLDAIIFDLDGVLTDTAEYHFRAWKRLADEEGIAFEREDNEKLRGVSRRRSLEILLDDHQVSKEQFQEMMDRKNGYYREFLQDITPADCLPGALELLKEIRGAGVKIAIASASKNAPFVVERLGLDKFVDALADGHSPGRPKPAPDLFLHAARQLGVLPARCIVVEDAEAGVEAGIAAGMITVGLGPEERVGIADLVLSDLHGVRLADLSRATTWHVSEATFEPEEQHHSETIFTQGNGYLGTRGTFEEGFEGDRPATLVHGVWDDVPIVFTELANAPDWTALQIVVDGQPFGMASGVVVDYARHLNLRTGVLNRVVRWRPSEGGPEVFLYFERLPSMADPHVLVSRVRVEAVDKPVMVEVQVPLDSRAENPGFMEEGIVHWDWIEQRTNEQQASILIRTRHTKQALAMSSRLVVEGPSVAHAALDCPGCPWLQRTVMLQPGESMVADKVVALITSRDVDDPLAAAEQTARAAEETGYEALRTTSDAKWTAFWEDSDVTIEGDDEAQVAVRHALFQLRIAASETDERVSIGAKSLSGFGYRGHAFWDTEIFMLPFFIYTQPKLARNLLMYRWHTLDGARRKATGNDLPGAQYAWESAETGDEVTPTWVPDANDRTKLIRIWPGDIEIHISADVAYAIWQYWQVTGDSEFMRSVGVPIILETAAFWGARAEPENGRYAFRNVIGPDEYHDHVDNNVFTNRMAQWHLETALKAHQWLHEVAPEEAKTLDERLDITLEQLNHWQDVIENLIILQDAENGFMEQFEGFLELVDVDWSKHEGRTRSMQAILGIEGANQHQVLKQADVILLLCLLRDEYDQRTWQVNWDYYVPRTDHSYGSSLGPATHAWAACEVGRPEDAYERFMQAARADLWNIRGNAGDGMHAASAGGLWQALAFGFAGLRLTDEGYTLNPQLPSHWKRLAFSFTLKGEKHTVDLRAAKLAGETS